MSVVSDNLLRCSVPLLFRNSGKPQTGASKSCKIEKFVQIYTITLNNCMLVEIKMDKVQSEMVFKSITYEWINTKQNFPVIMMQMYNNNYCY